MSREWHEVARNEAALALVVEGWWCSTEQGGEVESGIHMDYDLGW